MEKEIGSIEVGKLADLLFFDQNLLEADRYEIWKIRPSAVMMEGKVIHGALPNLVPSMAANGPGILLPPLLARSAHSGWTELREAGHEIPGLREHVHEKTSRR